MLKIGQNFRFVVLELVVGSSECDTYLFWRKPKKFAQKIVLHTHYIHKNFLVNGTSSYTGIFEVGKKKAHLCWLMWIEISLIRLMTYVRRQGWLNGVAYYWLLYYSFFEMILVTVFENSVAHLKKTIIKQPVVCYSVKSTLSPYVSH